MSMFPALKYTGYNDFCTSISLIILAPNEFSRELIFKCFLEFGPRNDGFVYFLPTKKVFMTLSEYGHPVNTHGHFLSPLQCLC